MSARLELSGIGVRAGERLLLEGISLELGPGERVALWGESGMGKTSLLRVVAQLNDASAGALRLDGRTPEDLGYPLWRRRVVYVAQRPALLAASVRENLLRPFSYESGNVDLDLERVGGLLERVGFPVKRLDEQARALSVGEQQRVCLVRALSLDPDVLLLDEPTSAVDAARRRGVEALLEEAGGAGLATLLVTHDREQADRLCHRSIDLAEYVPRG